MEPSGRRGRAGQARAELARPAHPRVGVRRRDGAGVRVCILDSGVELGHPLVGEVEQSWAVSLGEEGESIVEPDTAGDMCGHGTACAGIVRSLAPECELVSRARPR